MRGRLLSFVFLFLIVFILIAKALGAFLWNEPDEKMRELASEIADKECIIIGDVASRQEKTNSISYFLKNSYLISGTTFKEANLNSISENNSESLGNIILYTSKENPILQIGSTIAVYGKPSVYEYASNPGGFDARTYYAADNCCISVYSNSIRVLNEPGLSLSEIFTIFKERIRASLSEIMGEEEAGVLSAMLLGDRTDLSDDVKLDYSAAGISHILSISGMHVAIIGDFIYKLLLKLRLKMTAASITAAGMVVFYCAFTGASESTLRATIMLCIAYAGRCILRSYDSISALCLSGILILLYRPMALFRAGFQLSFAASAAINILLPFVKKRVKGRIREKKKRFGIKVSFKNKTVSKLYNSFKENLLNSVLVWTCVNIVTFPFVLYHFSEFPLYSVFSNIIFVPLMSVVMLLGIAGAALSLVIPYAAHLVLIIPELILKAQGAAGAFILKLPYSNLILGKPHIWQMGVSFAGIVILVIILNKKRKLRFANVIAPLAMIFLCAVRFEFGFSFTTLDVGQGDCMFIGNGGLVYMLDGGSSTSDAVGKYTIVPYIKSQGISRIEGVFLTHDDLDHYSGIEELFTMISNRETSIRVNYFFTTQAVCESEKGKELIEIAKNAGVTSVVMSAGDSVNAGGMKLRVLSPEKDSEYEGNESSLVLSLEYKDFSALLMGDLEGEAEDELLGSFGEYDCLKVAHHGSKNSGSDEFYEEVSPAVCIISAPVNSPYGHPHAETIERIERTDAVWYQTGKTGAITIKLTNKNKFSIERYKNQINS